MEPPTDARWQEWVIGACVVALSLFAVWTVFADDLAHLLSPVATPASEARGHQP